MRVRVEQHFDYLTPFSVAQNDEELAKILVLKYPKACSSLEINAAFFERMVKEVKQYEAWRVIGFESFEEFCTQKLGKTLTEVEEIVEGVKLLGGNPTEEQAKKASRSARAAEMVKAGTHTQAEAAREVGIDRAAVHRALTKPVLAQKGSTPKPPTIRLTLDPTRTAANIRAKMGAEYCQKLIKALEAPHAP